MPDDDNDLPDIDEDDIVYFRHDNPNNEKSNLTEDSFNDNLPNIAPNDIAYFRNNSSDNSYPNIDPKEITYFPTSSRLSKSKIVPSERDNTRAQKKQKYVEEKCEGLINEDIDINQKEIYSSMNSEMSNKKFQVEYDTGDLISKIIEKKEILEEFINFNQNLDMTKFGFPEEKILIEKEILNRFYRECTEKDPNIAEIFLDIVRPLSKGNSISLKEFKKIESLLGKEVPHKKIIGKKNQVCIEANKSNEISELLGLIWGRGRIDIKHPRYDLLIYLKGIHKDPIFITYLKNILMKALKVNENKIQINPNKEYLRLSGKVIIYELLRYGIFPKKSKYYHTIPLWIFEDIFFVLSFLKGILSINSMFSLRTIHDSLIPRYNLQFLVNKNSNKYLKAVQFLFHLFDLETNIYNNSLVIDKKSDLTRIIKEFLPPSIWNLMRNSLEDSLEDKNTELSDLLNYHEKVLISYHRDFAYNLISQFEQLGSFELVNEHIGKNGILGIDRIIDYVKKFFKEPDLVDVYGNNAYIHWYSNNKLIHIGTDLRSSKIPFKILKIILCEIYEVLLMNNFIVSNKFLINHLVDFFTTSELFKFHNTEIPKILRFGRISYLLKKKPSKKLLIEFFDNIIKFVRKIQTINELGYTTSYTKLAEEFNIIFYHHQQIKEIIDDLNNVFNIKLKIRKQNKYGKYKWTLNLIFKWNYKNFHKINNNLLKRNLGEILNIVENGNYGDEIFELRNPSCSQFYIKGDISHHLMDNKINHYNDQMIDKKIILTDQFSELGRKLVNYVNLSSIHYRDNEKAFSEKGNRVIHDYLQSYIRERDNNIIVTELLIWLPINNPSINADYIYGHIDFLFYFNNTLYVCDYKPLDKNFFRSLPQVCLYGLVLEKMLNISSIKIKCITFNQEQSWEFSPSILNTHVKEIIKKIQKINPSVKMEWNQYTKF
ncbi:MAG: hypothetical protein ACFFCV_18600 [Promethearchaeota archaeon]